MKRTRVVHRSIDYHRVESDRIYRPNSLEQTLAEEWERENDPERHNGGVLQALLRTHPGRQEQQHDLVGFERLIVTPRDAVIAATAVQWLGTNVGRCVLESAIKRAGFRLLYPSQIEWELKQEERTRRVRDGEEWLSRAGWRWA